VEVDQDHLGSRNKPQVLLRVAVKIVIELRQLSATHHDGFSYKVGRIHLEITVLTSVDVQQPGDQRPLKSSALPAEMIEATSGQLRSALEIDDAQRLAQIPVRFRLEIVAARPTLLAHHSVAFLTGTNRDFGRGYIGHLEKQPVELRLVSVRLRGQVAHALP
jgi:hypothetical protein